MEILVTMWHLTIESFEANQWQSTLDGKDVFYRNPPTDEELAKAMLHVAPSHPHQE
jgi:hypothetical protein